MKIHPHLPFWFPIVKKKFPTIPLDKVGVSWGDDVYSRDPQAFDHPQKRAHEAVHAKQQHHSKLYGLVWWWKYMRDPEFRFNEELQAYRVEWQWIQKNNRDKHMNWRYLRGMAESLSSEHYGKLCTLTEAKEYIDSLLPWIRKGGMMHTLFSTGEAIELNAQTVPEIIRNFRDIDDGMLCPHELCGGCRCRCHNNK